MRRVYCIEISCVLSAGMAFAQNNSGRISGSVTDKSGAVIPGATVVVTNQETSAVWKASTDNNGFYVATNLAVGTYSVEADATGFRKVRQSGYDLVDNGRITANFKLEIGAVTETIEVKE